MRGRSGGRTKPRTAHPLLDGQGSRKFTGIIGHLIIHYRYSVFLPYSRAPRYSSRAPEASPQMTHLITTRPSARLAAHGRRAARVPESALLHVRWRTDITSPTISILRICQLIAHGSQVLSLDHTSGLFMGRIDTTRTLCLSRSRLGLFVFWGLVLVRPILSHPWQRCDRSRSMNRSGRRSRRNSAGC